MADWPAGLPGYFHEDYDPHAFCVPRQYLEDAEAEIDALRRVAEAAEAVVGAQDKRWRIGLKGEAERNGAIERLRSMLAEWRRVRDLPEREGSGDGGGA